MSRILLTALVASIAIGTPLIAQDTQNANVFYNPCERGQWPHVSIINHEQASFVAFLQDIRPTMPFDVAYKTGYLLCGDMSLVGDSDGLTQRLNSLLRENGY
jgi:hypothetical protein